MVGQRFVQLLEDHPWFEIYALTGSERRTGLKYAETVDWKMEKPIPESVRELQVLETDPSEIKNADIVFSALPADVAAKVEEKFARAGFIVISNASAHRMEPDVPLINPEVNCEHVSLIDEQRQRRHWDGAILTNPNCTTAILTLSLKPIHKEFGLQRVIMTSMQALSGAGYPGVASLDIIDNIIPFIKDEEDKVEAETCKILGEANKPASIKVSASCQRVPVLDGHFETVFVETNQEATPADVIRVMESFTAEPQSLKLPLAPTNPIIVRKEHNRPQPRLDRDAGGGMSVVVGRVRRDPALGGIKYAVLGHNTIRGAAGCTILIGEYLKAKKYV